MINMHMKYIWYKGLRGYATSLDINRRSVINVTQEYFDEFISDKDHHDGELCAHRSFRSLGDLKSVGGNLILSDTKISTIGKIEHIGGGLNLCGTNINSLGNLRIVGGSLWLNGLDVVDLGDLKHVGGDIFCTLDSMTHNLLRDSVFKDSVLPHP